MFSLFSLSYRDDPGLAFLQFCSHGDLKDLADILMTDKGERRFTEQLSGESLFASNKQNLTKLWHLIAAELQRFGGDAFVNFFRGGKGVLYREILEDVCGRLKAEIREGEDFTVIESRVLLKALEKSLETMTEAERAEFVKSAAGLFANGQFNPSTAAPAAILAALQAAFAMGGFAAYQIAVVAANAVSKAVLGRGLAFAANHTLMRVLGVAAGPIGLAISGILSVPMVSGAAYRVTVPAVIYVAYLRQKYINGDIL